MCLLQGGEKSCGRKEEFIGRVSSHAKNGQNHLHKTGQVGRSVGRRTKLLFWTADFHSCRARRGVDRSRPPTRNTQSTRTNDCRQQLFPLPLFPHSLHQGRRCQGVHQNSDFKRSCDSRGGYRLMRQSPSLVGTRGVHHGEGAILCPV